MAARAAVEPLIDLGELVHGEPLPEPADRDPVRPRGMLVTIVALLAAAVLVGDRPPIRLWPLLTTPFPPASFQLAGDMLFVFDGPYAPNRVTAYELRGGRQLWQLDSTAGVAYERVVQIGSVTFLVPNPCIAATPVETVALDSRTGRHLWRRVGIPEQKVAGTGLVVMGRPGPTYGCGGTVAERGSPPSYWDGVEAATGAVVWSASIPQATRVANEDDDDARTSILISPDGTATSRDLRTGRATAQRRFPELALPDRPPPIVDGAPDGGPYLTVAGGLAILVGRRPGSSPAVVDITALDRRTLQRRWTSVVVPDGERRHYHYGVGGCGSMLCAYGGSDMMLLDPRDGRVRWHTRLAMVAVSDERIILADPNATNGQDPLGGLTMHDLRTGRRTASLDGWRMLAYRSINEPPLLGFTSHNRTWLAEVDLDSGSVAAVGSADGWYGSCDIERGILACRQLDGSVRVWRVTG